MWVFIELLIGLRIMNVTMTLDLCFHIASREQHRIYQYANISPYQFLAVSAVSHPDKIAD